MRPVDQCLDPELLAGGAVDDRSKVQQELLLAERPVDLGEGLGAHLGDHPHRGDEDVEAVGSA